MPSLQRLSTRHSEKGGRNGESVERGTESQGQAHLGRIASLLLISAWVALLLGGAAVGAVSAQESSDRVVTVQNVKTVTGCDVIGSSGTYELQGNIGPSSPCIEIRADNVTFNGNGYSVEGSGSGLGIYVNGRTNVTVKNVGTRDWDRGIWLDRASQTKVLNSTVETNTDGVHLTRSTNNSIERNKISDNENAGLRTRLSSDGNEVVNNTFTSNGGAAIANIETSGNEVVGNNVSSTNRSGIFSVGVSGTLIKDNTVADTGGTGVVLFSGASENEVIGNEVSGNELAGVSVVSSLRNSVQGNEAKSNNGSGIFLRNSSSIEVEENVVRSNGEPKGGSGIVLLNSSENAVRKNTVESNEVAGIGTGRESKSNRNIIENNTVNSNGWIGIGMAGSNNTIEKNTAYNNSVYGIGLGTLPSNNNELISNDIQFNEVGIGLNASSEDNVAIDNVIENNTEAIITEEGAEILIEGSSGGGGTETETQTVSTLETAEEETAVGTLNQEQKENAITNNSAKNSDVAYRMSNGAATGIENLNIGESSKQDTLVSLRGENVSVRSVANPPENPKATSIGRYLNATEETSDSFLNMGIRYTQSDVEGVNESSLSIWKHNGTEWREINSSVNTTGRVVNTSVTEFSTFGVFAETTATDPASFDVNITGTNSSVTEGETLAVDVNVTNTGDETATQTLNLTDTDFNNTERDSVSVKLNGGNFNNSITLEWNTTEGDSGTGNVTVFSENDTDTSNVTVEETGMNTPPVANFTFAPDSPSTTDTVEFNASLSNDPDGSITDYAWDFGDGSTGTGETVTHSYDNPGSFNVTLRVTDDDGATNNTNQVIVVDEETFEEAEEDCIDRREVSRGEEGRACPDDEGTERRDRNRRDRSRGETARDTDRRRNRGR